ncbi:MAG TPA: PP2C family protein-serine/threonine phosphatase [Acidimicrobiales bacterium]|nr:PP2C family protein-serine/threonine phosphatase [Acidimicrobiales bacterium]
MLEISQVLRRLLDKASTECPDELGALVDDAARHLGFDGAVIYLVDHEQGGLHPFAPGDVGTDVPIDGTVPGRVFSSGTPQLSQQTRQLWVALLDGTDRLGVLELRGSDGSEGQMESGQMLAGVTAQLLVAKTNYTDAFKLARRTRPMTIGADLVWDLLPPQSLTGIDVNIAAVLAPAYDLGGDAYDYAVTGRTADFAIFDAMGHGTPASLLATLTLATYRHARRLGLDLASVAARLDEVLAAVFPDHFVTGHLGRLDLDTGRLELLNAGHHLPMLMRQGRVLEAPDVPARLPLGLGPAEEPQEVISLEPGDRLLFFTDGVVEAHTRGGDGFGRERLAEMWEKEAASGLPTSETLRRLSRAVLSHLGDRLSDDATLLVLAWQQG